jgi:transposase
VRARARLINHVRGTVKSVGGHLSKRSSVTFAAKALSDLPPDLEPALAPLLTVIATLDGQISAYDQRIEEPSGWQDLVTANTGGARSG